jgi:hypothetical protein
MEETQPRGRQAGFNRAVGESEMSLCAPAFEVGGKRREVERTGEMAGEPVLFCRQAGAGEGRRRMAKRADVRRKFLGDTRADLGPGFAEVVGFVEEKFCRRAFEFEAELDLHGFGHFVHRNGGRADTFDAIAAYEYKLRGNFAEFEEQRGGAIAFELKCGRETADRTERGGADAYGHELELLQGGEGLRVTVFCGGGEEPGRALARNGQPVAGVNGGIFARRKTRERGFGEHAGKGRQSGIFFPFIGTGKIKAMLFGAQRGEHIRGAALRLGKHGLNGLFQAGFIVERHFADVFDRKRRPQRAAAREEDREMVKFDEIAFISGICHGG